MRDREPSGGDHAVNHRATVCYVFPLSEIYFRITDNRADDSSPLRSAPFRESPSCVFIHGVHVLSVYLNLSTGEINRRQRDLEDLLPDRDQHSFSLNTISLTGLSRLLVS